MHALHNWSSGMIRKSNNYLEKVESILNVIELMVIIRRSKLHVQIRKKVSFLNVHLIEIEQTKLTDFNNNYEQF